MDYEAITLLINKERRQKNGADLNAEGNQYADRWPLMAAAKRSASLFVKLFKLGARKGYEKSFPQYLLSNLELLFLIHLRRGYLAEIN